jgi:hypothetical protein
VARPAITNVPSTSLDWRDQRAQEAHAQALEIGREIDAGIKPPQKQSGELDLADLIEAYLGDECVGEELSHLERISEETMRRWVEHVRRLLQYEATRGQSIEPMQAHSPISLAGWLRIRERAISVSAPLPTMQSEFDAWIRSGKALAGYTEFLRAMREELPNR